MRSDLPTSAADKTEPLWPGFPARALAVQDPLGGDSGIEIVRGRHQLVHAGVPEVEALRRVLAAVSRSTDAPAAVRTALGEALTATGATAGSLWLFQRDGGICRAAHAGLTRDYLREFAGAPDWPEVQRDVGLVADVEVHDDGDLPWLPDHHRRMTPKLGLRSYAVVPLRTRGLRVGSVVLGHPQAGWFRDHSLEFLRTLGELVASALDNARLIAEIRDATHLHAELLHSAHDAIVFCDPDRRITEVNPALEALLGLSRDRLAGRDLLEFVVRPDAAGERVFRRLIECGEPVIGECRELRHAGGGTVPVVINAARVRGSGGETRGAVLTMRDERESPAGRPAALDADDPGGRILATLDAGVALVSAPDLAVLEHNPAFLRMVLRGGRHLAVRAFLRDLLPGGEESAVVAAAARCAREGRRVSVPEVEMRWANREPTFWSVVVAPAPPESADAPSRLVLALTDVSERRALEARYLRAQKMEALGTLAGGIAHEFNNLLTAILGQVSLALHDLPPGHPLQPGLRDCETAALRAAELTRQLLGFGRRAPVRLRPTNLREVVAQALPLFQHAIDPRIVIERQDAGDLWDVEADPAQMGQVLMNLCLNARDAMPSGGRLRIALANARIDQPGAFPPGEYVTLDVADTGEGMTPDVRARIFEPFYTTKGPDRGTGLGLAVVQGIVEQHGGWIECDSRPREGTRVRVGLPRLAVAAPAPPAEVPAGRGETVLVVDDEATVRNLSRSVLERNGYRVLLAVDGAEAVSVFRENRDRIALVLLDRTMPRLSGVEAMASIRAIAPGVRVLFTSGYGPGEGGPEEPAAQADGFLAKPFSPDQVLAAVHAALDSRR